jgi:glucose/arabinose dehydrogenase
MYSNHAILRYLFLERRPVCPTERNRAVASSARRDEGIWSLQMTEEQRSDAPQIRGFATEGKLVGALAAVLAAGTVLLACSGSSGNGAATPIPPPEGEDVTDALIVPPGFRVEVFSDSVPNARAMVLGERGTLFVGTRDDGRVFAVVDADQDGRADEVHTIAENLAMPAGVDMREGSLYVSAIDRVLRYDDIENRLGNPPEAVLVSDAFPDEQAHGWKFIRFGPDGWLYVPVGAPCNVCDPDDERFSTIMRMRPDGSDLEIFAHGVRNTVGFDWHPETRELWFTDNGRDSLGDDVPPDELNHAPQPGMHFGFPFCHGGTIADPEFGDQRPCSEFVPPVQNLGPHVAALGMRFYTGSTFPARYRGAIFIAEHGSWDRSTPIGYRVTMVTLDSDGKATSYEPFVHGWLDADSGTAWGRPADVLVHPDGSLLISDDRAGRIYRVIYEG